MIRARQTLDAAIREEDFQQMIIDLATLSGWTHYHTRDSRRSPAGFPDLVLARPPTVLFREIKSEGGRPTVEQQAWLDLLTACGVDAGVWRPSDWPDIEIELR